MWNQIKNLSLKNPIINSILKTFYNKTREEQLIYMVLELTKENERLLKLNVENVKKHIPFLIRDGTNRVIKK